MARDSNSSLAESDVRRPPFRHASVLIRRSLTGSARITIARTHLNRMHFMRPDHAISGCNRERLRM